MWYDILPSAAALITLLYLPSVILPYGQEFWTGNVGIHQLFFSCHFQLFPDIDCVFQKWYKNTDFPEVRINWFRDMYITGDAHRPTVSFISWITMKG